MSLRAALLDRVTRFSHGATIARRFAPDLAPHRFQLALVALITLATVALELVKPWPLKWIVDSALTGVEPSSLPPLQIVLWGSAAALSIVALDSVLDYFGAVRVIRIGQAFARGLRQRLFDHLSRLSPAFHARNKSGDLLVRLMGDVPLVRAMLVDSFVVLTTRVALVTGTIVAMILVDLELALAVLLVIPVFVGVLWWIGRQLVGAARRQRKAEGRLADWMQEAISASALIQVLGREGHTTERFAKTNRKAARTEAKASLLSVRLAVSVETLFGATAAAALAYGSYLVLTDGMNLGSLLVFLSYVRSLMKPVRSTSKHSGRVTKGVAAGERLLAILDEPIAIVSAPGAPPAPTTPARLAFEGVHFRYAADIEALRGLDACFERGQLVGLFGRSGSGKSTVAALAVRLYDPDQGRVLLDGTDVREYELGSLRERFGLAMQEPLLFGDTLRENLLLGRPDSNEGELRAALRAAAADEFVARLPAGLDTVLGSSGAGLSGGERRRLCLARTLLRRAPILIVDEPFSGLDRVAVDRVRASLAALAREAIVIVIAHDLDHLDAFDRILFLDEGRLDDSGTHAELLQRNDLYRRTTRALAATPS
ncbi:MAG: ABC transporter ATP-binding protein [Planctomycetota bacterium]